MVRCSGCERVRGELRRHGPRYIHVSLARYLRLFLVLLLVRTSSDDPGILCFISLLALLFLFHISCLFSPSGIKI